MRIRRLLMAATAVAAFVPGSAGAEGLEGRWSVALQGGTDLELSGKVHEGGSGTVLALPTSVEARSFKDVYDPGFRGQLAIGYGVSPAGEVFVRGSYYKMSSKTLQVGTVAGLVLNADFAEYKEWGAEVGYRYYFRADQPFKPYVAAAAGLRFVSELPATFSVPAAGVVLSDVPFYDSSTVGVFGLDLGFTVRRERRRRARHRDRTPLPDRTERSRRTRRNRPRADQRHGIALVHADRRDRGFPLLSERQDGPGARRASAGSGPFPSTSASTGRASRAPSRATGCEFAGLSTQWFSSGKIQELATGCPCAAAR